MLRTPRTDADRLVNSRLLQMAFLQIGVIQAMAGFTAYFAIMAEHGFFPKNLYHIRQVWESQKIITDCFGQEWVGILSGKTL